MGYERVKPCGGSGGKKGHSNMTHWTGTEEIKIAAKKLRRREAKQACNNFAD